MPAAMWSKLDLQALLNKSTHQRLEGLYPQNVALSEQFAYYVQLNAFGYYSHEDLDRRLLAALVAWDDEQPAEVDSLLRVMWPVLDLDETVVTEGNIDVTDRGIAMIRSGQTIRSAAFDRCHIVFSAHPATFLDTVADWVKERSVGKEVFTTVGGQLGKITTPSASPLIHCLQAAEQRKRALATAA